MARKTTDFIILHCSATKPDHDVDIRDVDRWHREKGWRKVGYHFFIKRDGTVQEGRGLMEGGAHAKGYNDKSVGICLAGGVAKDGATAENNFTAAQWEALTSLVHRMTALFPKVTVIGHRDIAPKDCPCFDAGAWWAAVKAAE